MRAATLGDATASEFTDALLRIGEGRLPIDPIDGLANVAPFSTVVGSIDELTEKVCPHLLRKFQDLDWLSERAILCSKNSTADVINIRLTTQLPGEARTLASTDSTLTEDEATEFPVELLNSLGPVGIPPHLLNVKVGTPLILMRNLDPPRLCNGTTLAVKSLSPNLITATIMTGCGKRGVALLPRMLMVPSEDLSFTFKRVQFPVRQSFAMTINKSQRQSLKVAGV